MKPSEITVDTVIDFVRCDDCGESRSQLEYMLSAARGYVCDYTGLTEEECDEHEDITIAVLCLCSDMFDNRQTTVDRSTPNRTVETILGMHSKNLL